MVARRRKKTKQKQKQNKQNNYDPPLMHLSVKSFITNKMSTYDLAKLFIFFPARNLKQHHQH